MRVVVNKENMVGSLGWGLSVGSLHSRGKNIPIIGWRGKERGLVGKGEGRTIFFLTQTVSQN